MVHGFMSERDPAAEDAVRGRRVVICEDHPTTRLGFRESCVKLGCAVVAETGLGAEAIELVELHRPDLLILDQYLPDHVDGPQVQQAIRRQRLETKVLVITSYCDSASFFSWIERADGPDGVLPKDTSLYHVRSAIVQLLTTDERYIPDSVWNQENGRGRNPLRRLAPHEMRVLREVAQGYRLIDIARRHNLAVGTVRSYTNDIYCKLDLPTNTLQAAGAVYIRWVAGGDLEERQS
jgi:two-component system, NarL family, nitrate/nitrite response regulator NarL